MAISRRSFIKWVLAGAATASPFGCAPGGKDKPSGAASAPVPGARLGSERNKDCHDVRDGLLRSLPPPSRSPDDVVVGRGPSGLAAAERCFGSDSLLLDKDDHVGGNCWTETWEGLDYRTGSAWLSLENDEVRVYRRGHPMPMPAPGSLSRLQPVTQRDMAPIYFSHSDNSGTVSDMYEAALGATKAAAKALQHV